MPNILFKLDKGGRLRYWECVIDGPSFKTRHGLLKTRNTHTWQTHMRSERHAVGHGSYASAEEVAREHALSRWKEKKRNDAMVENPLSLGIEREELAILCDHDPSVMSQCSLPMDDRGSYPVPIAPVLAVRYDKLKERHENPSSKYKFPHDEVYVQYKIDGERCIASWVQELDENGNKVGEPGVRLFSRIRNEIPFCDHIKKVMHSIYTTFGKVYPPIYNCHFDGELVVPGETRNMMRSAVSTMRHKHEANERIEFYIFDMVTRVDHPFEKRWTLLTRIMSKVKSAHVKLVPIPTIAKVKMDDDETITTLLAEAMGRGYEGLMLRTKDMPYPIGNHRIDELVKVKKIHDEEFLIIGCYQGRDKEEGLIVFQMQDLHDSTITFGARPCWPYEVRKEAWDQYVADPSSFVGKKATIAYEYKSEYRVPGNPRLIRLRDDI